MSRFADNCRNIASIAAALVLCTAAAARAHAEVQAVPEQCGGKNMLTEIQTSDWALYRRIMDDAAKVENTRAILWKVDKTGVPPSYLFGTIHMPDKRVTDLPPAAREAFARSKTVVLEIANMSDEGMIAAVSKTPQLLAYLDGKTLQSQLSPEEFDKVVKVVGKAGMPAQAAAVLRPWLVSMLLAISDCQRAQMQAGRKALDAQLEADAKRSGAAVVGLETAESQLASMASIPNDQQLLMLKSGLAYVDRTNDLVETLVELYLSRNLGATIPFQVALAGKVGIPSSAFDGFIKILLTDRNKRMAEAAKPILEKGNAFIAIGALHLSGKTGVIALLREAGYAVAPIE
jgi:uncharacterized protein YbaP (TraB family)